MSEAVKPDLASLRAQVRAARARAQTLESIDLEIPGYDGTLWGTFRALDDYKEAKDIGAENRRIKDESEQELAIGAATLAACSLDVFVPQEGFVAGEDHDKVSLGMTLGVDLAQWLELDGAEHCETDSEAMFLIFPNTLQLAAVAGQVNMFSAGAGRKADGELEGNSLAPSSSSSVPR